MDSRRHTCPPVDSKCWFQDFSYVCQTVLEFLSGRRCWTSPIHRALCCCNVLIPWKAPLGECLLGQVGKQRLVRSVPGELNTDKSVLLELAQANGCVSLSQIQQVGHPSFVPLPVHPNCVAVSTAVIACNNIGLSRFTDSLAMCKISSQHLTPRFPQSTWNGGERGTTRSSVYHQLVLRWPGISVPFASPTPMC